MHKSEAKDPTKILRLVRLKSTCNILVEKETEKNRQLKFANHNITAKTE